MSRPAWEAAVSALGVTRGLRFLDAGCGAGGAVRLAADRGATVSGIDASSALIAIARGHLPDADFRVGELEQLPFGGTAFDAILAANSIQYAGSPATAAAELYRVCARGARIALIAWSSPERCEQREIFRAVLDALPAPPPGEGPFALSPPGALEGLAETAGFRVLEVQEVSCPFEYSDLALAWRAQRSAGPLQGAIAAAGEDRLRAAVTKALQVFVQPDGRVRLENWFRCLIARKDA